jgi:deoxyadenosine/deoxycytidine kinase
MGLGARMPRKKSASVTPQPPLFPAPEERVTNTLALCDFHPFKSLIFASVVLSQEARDPLRQLYRSLHIPDPDLVVYLRADEDTILARLRKRNDVYWPDIDRSYITRVCQAYNDFFRTYRGDKVVIDTSFIDYVDDPQALSALLQEIPLLYASPFTQRKDEEEETEEE